MKQTAEKKTDKGAQTQGKKRIWNHHATDKKVNCKRRERRNEGGEMKKKKKNKNKKTKNRCTEKRKNSNAGKKFQTTHEVSPKKGEKATGGKSFWEPEQKPANDGMVKRSKPFGGCIKLTDKNCKGWKRGQPSGIRS